MSVVVGMVMMDVGSSWNTKADWQGVAMVAEINHLVLE